LSNDVDKRQTFLLPVLLSFSDGRFGGSGFFFESYQNERNGLTCNIRFHDLRHSAASLLLTIGVHPKVVQELLGHSQISLTLDIYSHVLPSMQQEAMGKLDDLFKKDS
jgi:integrase